MGRLLRFFKLLFLSRFSKVEVALALLGLAAIVGGIVLLYSRMPEIDLLPLRILQSAAALAFVAVIVARASRVARQMRAERPSD